MLRTSARLWPRGLKIFRSDFRKRDNILARGDRLRGWEVKIGGGSDAYISADSEGFYGGLRTSTSGAENNEFDIALVVVSEAPMQNKAPKHAHAQHVSIQQIVDMLILVLESSKPEINSCIRWLETQVDGRRGYKQRDKRLCHRRVE